ncbi:uncharacterized protein LOC121737570, partial [Aricia agestis]|uniref:uncharacterized protein LOC121737570 n=1 Tax=Aricia agestis TaxID=91739 RepID=UPI001C202531
AAGGELAGLAPGVQAVAAGEAREARFVLGSRYGRSAPAPRFMSPRNDRFFMSSRYGKRSGVGGGTRGARGQRACRCGPYDAMLALPLARYTRRPAAGGAPRAG